MFCTLVPPHPNAPFPPPPSAYLYLAQLSDDDQHAALSHYQTAIDILQSQLKGKLVPVNTTDKDDGDGDGDEVKSNIIRAYLGMVEIWMDPAHDLWCVSIIVAIQRDLTTWIYTQVSIQVHHPHATHYSLALSKSTPEI